MTVRTKWVTSDRTEGCQRYERCDFVMAELKRIIDTEWDSIWQCHSCGPK